MNYVKEYNREIRAWLLQVFEYSGKLAQQPLARRHCPVCGSDHGEFYANNGYFDYSQCSKCSLIYQSPSPEGASVNRGFMGDDALLMEYFNIARKYKSTIPAKSDPMKDGKLRDIYAVKPAGNLLDVGCSVGDFLHTAKYFYDVEGVEVNPHTAAVAEQYFTVHKKFLSELDLGPRFDIVTLHQILYGVPDPVQLLCDIHTVLKADGILYINTPNADSYAMELYRGQCCHLYGYTSLNVFNEHSLNALADLTGFRVVSFRTEWLDVYVTDLQEYYDHSERFIHKRNCHLPDYEEKIAKEDELHAGLGLELGKRGNYLVALLAKA